MHPKIHKDRRKARSKHTKDISRGEKTCYTSDATTYKEHSGAVVSVVDHQLREINCASIKGNILEAEEAGIALAITHQGEEAEILTDSQEECRRYSSGRISTVAIRILKTRKITFSRCSITWTPGHETVTGNQRADANARALRQLGGAARRGTGHSHETLWSNFRKPKSPKEHLPPFHKDLSREHSVAWS
ncbi:hypothetical protein HPB49_025365 [Dermacentor silvarum]|uniref:Uncharacterized protein n=1 Tax=Dermacentor silvarum TaxID=543639 RepID=A0ACB8CIF9_DERSI|nr:hypothetical protein HPB49_025365 [Dermacentor silvarum]